MSPTLPFAQRFIFCGLTHADLEVFRSLVADEAVRTWAGETDNDRAENMVVALVDYAREHAGHGDFDAIVDASDVTSHALFERLGFARVNGVVNGTLQAAEANAASGVCYRLPKGRAPLRRRTGRLLLRPFIESDRDAFARMNADPRVMEHFPNVWTRAESDAAFDRITGLFDTYGFGPWALERSAEEGCIGMAGLSVPRFESHFTPCVELLWRLSADHWGHGYAQDAARAALYTAFVHLGLTQVVAFTATCNRRSERVMQRLGMTHDAKQDFDHPSLPHEHPLCRHVLYRLDADTWRSTITR